MTNIYFQVTITTSAPVGDILADDEVSSLIPRLTAAMARAEYWKRWEADADPCIFPSLVDTTRGQPGEAQISLDLDDDVTIRLQEVASQYDVPADVILALSWALLLKTFTGNASVSFSVYAKDEATLCALSIETAQTVASLIESTNFELLRSRENAAASLDEISVFRDADGRPFCSTAVYLNSETTAKEDFIDLSLRVLGTDSRPRATFSYASSRLAATQAEDVAATFLQLLSEICNKPESSVAELVLVHPSSLERLFGWNREYPQAVDRCVGDVFQKQVALRPDNMAVNSSDVSFTYRELDLFTLKLAAQLQVRGIGPEVVVLLCFPKSAWAVVAMIAVVRAGGTMLFFDASHPLARLQEIQSQVKSKIMLTAPDYAQMWDWTDAEVLIIDRPSMEQLPSIETLARPNVTPSNMLYIIYTSGSTGKPKGCVIEHRQFLTGSYAQQNASGMTHNDRVLQLASFTFDVSILEIITSLVCGACVCIPGDGSRAKGPAHCIDEFKVTWAFLTPSLVRLMTPEMVPGLRFLALGGEALARDNVEIWAPRLQLANGYGPTECKSHTLSTVLGAVQHKHVHPRPADSPLCQRTHHQPPAPSLLVRLDEPIN